MRRLFILPIAILATMGVCVTSCGPSAQEKRLAAQADSARRADSIAQIEAARLAAIKEDSIRRAQDSLARIEEFQAKIPSFEKIYNGSEESLRSYLTGLGFSRTSKGKIDYENGYDPGSIVITYRKTLDDSHYCVIKFSQYFEGFGVEYNVVGFPAKMQEAKAAAKKYMPSPDDEHCGMTIKSTKIEWGCGA